MVFNKGFAHLWLFFSGLFLLTPAALCEDVAAEKNQLNRSPVIEEWSASVLGPGQFAIGSIAQAGLGLGLMVGTDPTALTLGARTGEMKFKFPSFGEDDWALGLKYISVERKSLWWGDMDEYFDELSVKVLRPSIAWSNRVSQRLIIHSFWASGFGKSGAALSSVGRQRLADAKHGTDKSGDGHSFANRTVQLQSLAGFTEDRFQITAEWERSSGDRILLATRFERTRLEQLESFSMRTTLAQQWTSDHLNLRLGGGPQYVVLLGKDLDGEDINTSGWLPAADLALYWIF